MYPSRIILCYKCKSKVKIGFEWRQPYYYCPTCREDRKEDGTQA